MQSLSNIVTAPQRATRTDTCEQHGEYESKNYVGRVWSKCPECERLAREAYEVKHAAQKREEERRRWEARLERSCIPERFLDRTLKNYEAKTEGQQQALAFATPYADIAGRDLSEAEGWLLLAVLKNVRLFQRPGWA